MRQQNPLSTRPENRFRRDAGQATLMVTVGLAFTMGILGLVVDAGYGYYVKQCAQAAADSAALAAGAVAASNGGTCGTSVLCQTGYSCPSSPDNSTNFGVGCLYAKANGFSGSSVTLNAGSGGAGGVTNTNYWVSASVTRPLSLSFLRVIGFSSSTVAASATSGVVIQSPTGGCIYVLDPSINTAMTVSGGSSFIKSDCGIYVNSSGSSALTVSGGATVAAGVVDVVGSTSISGGSSVTPSAVTGVSAAADPFANLPAPSFSGCDHTNYSINGGTATISSGVYCGGITISGGATVTFGSGTYILNGGGLTVSGGTTNVVGSGVFFYNTSSGYTYKPVVLSGGNSTSLSAPTSGTYQGILIFDDRTIKTSAKNTISGGTGANITGTIYMPSQQLVFSGGSTSGPWTAVMVADTFEVSGGSYLAKDPTGALTGTGKATTYLIQ